MRKRLFTAVIAASLICGCSSDSSSQGPDPRLQLLESWWADFLSPELDALTDANGALEAAAKAHCETPTDTSLAELKEAWETSQRHLKRQEVFAFGPYTEEPERFRAELDFWPVRPDSIEEILAGENDVSAENVAGFGGPGKGLPAAEYLIWNEVSVDSDERRCAYLQGISGAATTASMGLKTAWDPEQDGHYGLLLNPSSEHEYETIILSVSAVVNRLWFTIENIRLERLGEPLGTTSGGSAQPEIVESRFSNASILAVQANLAGVEELYFGKDDSVGLAQFVGSTAPELNEDVRRELDASKAALDAIQPNLADAVVNDPATVQAAMDQLLKLQTLIEVDVISELGLSRSFNDTDGD